MAIYEIIIFLLAVPAASRIGEDRGSSNGLEKGVPQLEEGFWRITTFSIDGVDHLNYTVQYDGWKEVQKLYPNYEFKITSNPATFVIVPVKYSPEAANFFNAQGVNPVTLRFTPPSVELTLEFDNTIHTIFTNAPLSSTDRTILFSDEDLKIKVKFAKVTTTQSCEGITEQICITDPDMCTDEYRCLKDCKKVCGRGSACYTDAKSICGNGRTLLNEEGRHCFWNHRFCETSSWSSTITA